MRDRVYPITDVPSARDVDLSKVSLEKLRSRDSRLYGLEKINFCLKIVNDGWMDEIAKNLTEKDESGNIFFQDKYLINFLAKYSKANNQQCFKIYISQEMICMKNQRSKKLNKKKTPEITSDIESDVPEMNL